MKYGYDSPDSFTKAFIRFHGIRPSSAKEHGAVLRAYAPLHIKYSLEGGGIMDYRIEEKEALKLIGMKRTFQFDDAYQNITMFWEEFFKRDMEKRSVAVLEYVLKNQQKKKTFTYMIADLYDGKQEIRDEFTLYEIPKGEWAIFTAKGPCPSHCGM